MTDGVADARPNFVFIKAHMRGDTGCTDGGCVFYYLLILCLRHRVHLFCLDFDASLSSAHPALWPLGTDRQSEVSHTHLSAILTMGNSHYTDTADFSSPTTTCALICFVISPWCLLLQCFLFPWSFLCWSFQSDTTANHTIEEVTAWVQEY